jgi:hypothetical protein
LQSLLSAHPKTSVGDSAVSDDGNVGRLGTLATEKFGSVVEGWYWNAAVPETVTGSAKSPTIDSVNEPARFPEVSGVSLN